MKSQEPIQSGGHPKLQNGQYAVRRTDICPGVVQQKEGRHPDEGGVVWLVFDSLQAACKYAASDIAEHPSAEYTVYNSDEKPIQTFNKKLVDDIASDVVAAYGKEQKRWWQFWKP